MELIAVVMKGETSDKRNTDAKALLNYGFSAVGVEAPLPETLAAQIQQGQQVGTLTLCSGDTEVLTVPILAAESVPGRSWGRMFTDLLTQAVFLA